jgi:hypothetical protein
MHTTTALTALMADEGRPARRDARTYSLAMLLTGGPRSPEAEALISTIIDTVIVPSRQGTVQLRPSMRLRYREALGPFLADLFYALKLGRWSKLRTNHGDMALYPGKETAFEAMRAAMGATGLLEELPGFFREEERFGIDYQIAAMTSFRPTPKLVQMAEGHGVTLGNLSAHFMAGKAPAPPPCDVVEARSAKATKGARTERLPIDPEDLQASAITTAMERLNAFLMEDGRIEGITFAGLRRIYSNADRPGFAWQWGGRFYSMPRGNAYEGMSDGGGDGAGGRARAAVLRIDGEDVVEVDLSAAHLTILHGLLGLPFDATQASYELPGVNRAEVKRWIMIALGASDPMAGGRRFAPVRRAALERFPALADLGSHGISTYDLQYHEAEIMMMAMQDLMEQGVGFLPVHDALCVPRSQQALAAAALTDAFRRYFVERLGMDSAPVPRVH